MRDLNEYKIIKLIIIDNVDSLINNIISFRLEESRFFKNTSYDL